VVRYLNIIPSPSIHKFEDEPIYSGLSAMRAKFHNQVKKIKKYVALGAFLNLMNYYDIDKDIFSRGCKIMPRQARLDTPGTLHHVIIRGIEKKHLVDDVKDKKEFVFRMDDGSRRRFVSEARRIIACRLVKDYGIPLSEIARRVGVSTSAVSKMINSVAN
jgi:hypothetical protein